MGMKRYFLLILVFCSSNLWALWPSIPFDVMEEKIDQHLISSGHDKWFFKGNSYIAGSASIKYSKNLIDHFITTIAVVVPVSTSFSYWLNFSVTDPDGRLHTVVCKLENYYEGGSQANGFDYTITIKYCTLNGESLFSRQSVVWRTESAYPLVDFGDDHVFSTEVSDEKLHGGDTGGGNSTDGE